MVFYILNGSQEIVETIQSPATDGAGGVTALNGVITEKLSSYELMELSLPGKADGLENIHEGMTIVFEDISGWKEYIIYEIEDEDGSDFSSTIRAELASSELIDEIIEEDVSKVSKDPATILKAILEGTRYQVGVVDPSLYSQSFNTDTTYMNVLEVINDFAKRFKAEIKFSYQVDGNKVVNRFVNVYKEYGEYKGKILEIDRDMTNINRVVNTENIKTTIIPYSTEQEEELTDEEIELGKEPEKYILDIKDVVWSKEDGDPVDKPKGQSYLVDEEALSRWGIRNNDGSVRHREISMEFDLDNAESIASMAWVQLGRYTKPKASYEVNAVDLYEMTKDEKYKDEQLFLGDTAGVKDHFFSRPVELMTRLVEVERDLFDSRNNQYIFGNPKQILSVNDGLDKIEEVLDDKLGDLENDLSNDFQVSIDGTTKIYRGSNDPVKPNTNDLWFKPHPSKPGHTQMLLFNGVSWDIQADTSDLEDASRIKFGILDGAEINVINLIADSITGGKLKLETGLEITHKGREILTVNSAGEVEMNVSKITINTKDLEDKLDETKNEAKGEASEYTNSQIKISNDNIRSEVSNEINGKVSAIDQKVDSIELSVGDKITGLGARVSVTEEEISSKVSSTDFNGDTIASLITQTPSAISLVSRNIDLTGRVTFNSFSTATTNKINGIESEAGTAKARADSAYSRAGTALTSAGTASSTASTALSRANSAKDTTDGWRYGGTTEIDGGSIRTNTIETNDLRANGTLWGHHLYGGSISLGNSKTEFSVDTKGNLEASGGGFKVPATADGVYNNYHAPDTRSNASRWKFNDSNYLYQDHSQARFYIGGTSRFRFTSHESNEHWGIRISNDALIVALSTSGQVNFRNANNTDYIAIGATDFKVGSNKSLKQNIKPAKTSLKTVVDTPVYNFEFKRGFINTMKNTDKNTKTGFIVEESPLEILGDDNSVSMTNSIGVLWKAVQELNGEVDRLNEEVNTLKGESIDE